MRGVPSNLSEPERIRILNEYNILDTPAEKEFDDLADLASAICEVPISLITLVDSERQWFKSKKGIAVPEAPRKISFCHHAIQNPTEVMVVQDSTLDERFKDNPLVVGDPHFRFYAGAPLVNEDNVPLGTLCVIDNKPRNLSGEQRKMLSILAKRVVNLMELRKASLKQKSELKEVKGELKLTLNRLIDAQNIANIGSWDWDLQSGEVYWSPKMYELFGLEELADSSPFDRWQEKIHPDDIANVKDVVVIALKENTMPHVEYRIRNKGEEIWVSAIGKTIANERGEVIRVFGTVQDITATKRAEVAKSIFTRTLQDMLFDLSHKIRQPLTNCMALVQIFNQHDLTEKAIKEYANYLNVSVDKMDEYLREVSTYVHRNKEKIA